MDGFTIATITLARSVREEKAILNSLGKLKGYSTITADGGSTPRFIASLHKLGLQIVCPTERGLVGQVKASLRAALDASDTPLILYTEPDKVPFFARPLEELGALAKRNRTAALLLAGRDSASFKSFPEGQRRAETFMNESTSAVLGKKADYCYGPIVLTRAAARLALEAPEHLGWGWRFWLLGQVARKKKKFEVISLRVPCPREQRNENGRSDQIYRMKQLRQNLEGLFLGLGIE